MEQFDNIGNQMYNFIATLYPICRSITGEGVRKTLSAICKLIPLEIREIPSGTKVFDWIVPKEWNIKDAYIIDPTGNKIVDFKNSNLHVLNYSIPIHAKLPLSKLKEHLFTLPESPKTIPYLTTYYKENWGFCLSHDQFLQLKDGNYEVFIDSTLENGSLTYGEFFLPGNKDEEVLLSTYVCHPSLCNDNLSGISLLTFLAKEMKERKLNYSYRFLFIPETIGAITWLYLNEDKVSKIKHGLVATCLGDDGKSTYKKTKNGNAPIDKVVEKVLAESNSPYEIIDFFPSGSDERQFNSPGFNLPIGSLMRTRYGCFDEYHTSADDLDFIKPQFLEDSFKKYSRVVDILEHYESFEFQELKKQTSNLPTKNFTKLNKNNSSNRKDEELIFLNLNPKCEPQLGKRGLYQMIGGQKKSDMDEMTILWILTLSDGSNSLFDISNRSGISFEKIKNTADLLVEKKLLKIKSN